MKKVLFVIPTLGGGGAERVLVNLVNNLNSEKYKITLFTLFNKGENRKLLKDNVEHKFFFKKIFRGNIHFLKLFSPRQLYKLMIIEDYDIIISYLEGPTTRIVSGCTNPNTVLLNWVHTEVDNEQIIKQSYRNRREVIECYNKFENTIFVSKTALNAFQKVFHELEGRFIVKYNSVDNVAIITKSKEEVHEINFVREKINLVSVGRFVHEKGYIRLINIIVRLVKEGYNIHLYLIGKGEEIEKYKDLIKTNNIQSNITIVGFNENPYKYVAKCDLFVCSSYKEGYSTAVTESLIVGTPVITTLCSGMTELLGENDEYGIITENSEEKLYKGLINILKDPVLLKYYKQKAIERGRIFSLQETVEAIEATLDSFEY